MLFFWGWAFDPLFMGNFLREGRASAFLFGVILFTACEFAKTWDWIVAAFYAYLGIMTIEGRLPSFSSPGLLMITATLFIVPVIFRYVSVRWFENTVIVTAWLHSIVGILNVFGIYATFGQGSNRFYEVLKPVVGLLGQHMILAPYLIFAFGLCLSRAIHSLNRRQRTLYSLSSFVFFVLTIVAKSSIAYAALGASLSIYITYYLGLGFAALAGLLATAPVAIAGYYKPEILGFSGRQETWHRAYQILTGQTVVVEGKTFKWAMAPWRGYGQGSWSMMAQYFIIDRNPRPWAELHCDPFQALLEYGRIGFSFIVLELLSLAKKSMEILRSRDHSLIPYVAGFSAFFVDSLGAFPMHVTPLGQFTMICAYLILKKGKFDER